MNKVLLFFTLKYSGNWEKVYDALDRKEKVEREELDVVENKISCRYITILDPQYPSNLRLSYRPPFVLFYEGNVKLFLSYYRTVGIVYDDKSINYQVMKRECKDLLNNKLVLLTSFDTEACESILEICVKRRNPSVCILSSSIKRAFKNHKVLKDFVKINGLVVSEVYNDEPLSKQDLNFRLRIYAGLTSNVLFINTSFDNYWNLVAEYILNNGNNIYAISKDCVDDEVLQKKGVIKINTISEFLELI